MDAGGLVAVAARLRKEVGGLRFGQPVACVYNPLDYAWRPHEAYLRRWGASPKRIIFLGMNPGPWGMAQTGVPFGEVAAVRDWVGVCEPVGRPSAEHPARPIEGFACRRSEVSGARLWGLFRSRFGAAEAFFADHFVANYCPLVFMEASGKNLTPDKLRASETAPLWEACDRHLAQLVRAVGAEWVIGVGAFAQARALAVREATGLDLDVGRIPHPSPANPAANRGWAKLAEAAMIELGAWRA
ncbi:MAG TPA: single-stranded DNA-binding protein [Verrucomicrobiae bacterium]|nr:single-stranded DNA-binding protein [Verrucomicrobiae bacterium]